MALKATAKWKEELVINDERDRSFVFDCGWGVDPPVAYIPPIEQWERIVPDWLKERRAEVVEAMKKSNHLVEEGWYASDPEP